MSIVLVAAYLAAIVIANLAVVSFGQAVMPVVAFVLIPFDLVARDALHRRWHDDHLVARMGALIAAGSALTILVSPASHRIALASCISFAIAAAIDTGAYETLEGRSQMVKVNGSNAFSATADSIVFPLIAFGALSWQLSAAQAAAKFFGGFVWSLMLRRLFK